MSLLHITFDHDTQIFIVGFFAAMITLWPVCMLFLLPHDLFVAEHVLTSEVNIRIGKLVRDNDQLRLELIDHKAIIDALLRDQMK
jgi:hypothetical protein